MSLLSALMALGMVGAQPARTYLALGDSYTIGESVPEQARWPVQLADALRKRGLEMGEPTIIAQTGWTTDELSAAMDAAELAPCYDLVSLLIGVNNQYRGRDVDDFRVEFSLLLDRAIALAGGSADRVFVVSIPDWGYTPFAQRSGRDLDEVSAQIDAYNAATAEIAAARKVRWFDITPSTRKAREDRSLIADDDLHPSARLYEAWVAQIADDVDVLVRDSTSGCRR